MASVTQSNAVASFTSAPQTFRLNNIILGKRSSGDGGVNLYARFGGVDRISVIRFSMIYFFNRRVRQNRPGQMAYARTDVNVDSFNYSIQRLYA